MNLQNIDTAIGFTVIILMLSLLVTSVVQLIVAVTNLRGENLRWGLTKLITQIDPTLTPARAKTLAIEVLKHSAIAPGKIFGGEPAIEKIRLATAIRPDEFIRLVSDLVEKSPATDAIKNSKLASLAITLPNKAEWAQQASEIARQIAEANATEVAKLQAQLQKLVADGTAAAAQVSASVNVWFDSIMDRTTELFTVRTRLITLVVAVALVAAFRIDSIAIFEELSSNHELRAKLVAGAETTLRSAESTLASATGQPGLATTAIREAKAAWDSATPKRAAFTLAAVPSDLPSRDAGKSWISRELRDPVAKEFLKDYETAFDKLALARFEEAGARTLTQFRDLKDTNIVFIRSWSTPWSWRHFWGLVISAVFLSFGAPFWHTALRNLVALRPAVASKIDKESAAG